MIFRPHLVSADLLRVDVVDAFVGDVEARIAIDSDAAPDQDFVGLRIVLSKVSINIGVPNMNGHVVAGGGNSVLVSRFPAGSNLDRFVI